MGLYIWVNLAQFCDPHWKPNQSHHDSEKGVQLLSQNGYPWLDFRGLSLSQSDYSGEGVIPGWLPFDSTIDSGLVFSASIYFHLKHRKMPHIFLVMYKFDIINYVSK